VASLVASTAAYGSAAVMNFAVQRVSCNTFHLSFESSYFLFKKLYYDTNVEATTAVLATFSTACFGFVDFFWHGLHLANTYLTHVFRYGLVGLLRPLTVYPSEMVYWANLPTVAVFQGTSTTSSPLCPIPTNLIHPALHFDTAANAKRLKLFWTSFTGMFIYEVFPAYVFPLLNGFNIVCLASQKASSNTVDVITNLFGGSDGNEGLGFLSLSFDWQYIGSGYVNHFPFVSGHRH